MKTTDYILYKIDRLPKGYVFTCADFINEVNNKETVIKALNRMTVSGKISKLSKGKFYKPENTVFGALQPNQYQVVKDLLEEDGKAIGYLTGYSIYNQLALPMGIGLKFRNNRMGFALDWGIRGTLTDYLDDVGSFYSQNLPANDITKLNYQRGEIFNNDWYVVTGFSFYVNLTSRRLCPN